MAIKARGATVELYKAASWNSQLWIVVLAGSFNSTLSPFMSRVWPEHSWMREKLTSSTGQPSLPIYIQLKVYGSFLQEVYAVPENNTRTFQPKKWLSPRMGKKREVRSLELSTFNAQQMRWFPIVYGTQSKLLDLRLVLSFLITVRCEFYSFYFYYRFHFAFM